MEETALDKLTVIRTTKKILAFYGTRSFCAHTSLPPVPVLSRRNLAHAFPPYF